MGRLLEIAKATLAEIEVPHFEAPKAEPGIHARPITPASHTSVRQEVVNARIRGKACSAETAEAEVCFHCHGEKICRCALCAVPGANLTWKKGRCGTCLGTGFLTWPDKVQ